MSVELVTCVMIEDFKTNEVLIIDRKLKYPGWSFPGGHVERGESICDCAVREVKEETGLEVSNLKNCGVVHWVNRDNDERYLCFMFKTSEFKGTLITETDEGNQFWINLDELFASPKTKFSSTHYCLSPLFHEFGKYNEVFIHWSGDESTWNVYYK